MYLFAASVVKAVLRYGKKQFVVDETRRDNYKNPVTLGNERPVLSTVFIFVQKGSYLLFYAFPLIMANI